MMSAVANSSNGGGVGDGGSAGVGGALLAFDNVFMHQVKGADLAIEMNSPGRLKIAAGGLGWKEGSTGKVVTIASADVSRVFWIRVMRQYQLRFQIQDGITMHKFDGIPESDFGRLEAFFNQNWALSLEHRPIAVRGWNGGSLRLVDGGNLEFEQSVLNSGSPLLAFDLPIEQVANALSSNKDELSIEFIDGASRGLDSISEMRFFIPNEKGGRRGKMDDDEDEGDDGQEDNDDDGIEIEDKKGKDSDAEEEDEENPVIAKSAAKLMAEKINAFVQIRNGAAGGAGDHVASLPGEIACILPRGRFSLEVTTKHLRMKGKSNDHRIPYSSIVKTFLLPRADETHLLIMLQLDPPLRQGQTRYPFVTFQMHRDEQCTLDFSASSDLVNPATVPTAITTTTANNTSGSTADLVKEGTTYEVLASLLRVLAGQKIIVPGSSFNPGPASPTVVPAVKCNYKASEGWLYFLERSLIYMPKPVILIAHNEISFVEVARIGSGSGNPRSFDLRIMLRRAAVPGNANVALGGNGQEILLSNVAKELFPSLEAFFRLKGIEMEKRNETVLSGSGKKKANATVAAAAALSDDGDDAEDGAEDGNGSNEEESSTDEDYAEGDSDEFGSASSSESESGSEADDDDDDDDEEEDDE